MSDPKKEREEEKEMEQLDTETDKKLSEGEKLSQEEQDRLMEKYDTESNTRDLTGIIGTVVFLILIAFSLFQIYTGIFRQYTAYVQRTVHLGFALVLIFLLFPARRDRKSVV